MTIQIPMASAVSIPSLPSVASARPVVARTTQPPSHAFQAAAPSEAKSKSHGAASIKNAQLSFAELMIVLFHFLLVIATSSREGHQPLPHAATRALSV
jgi:hypothetical protein